MRKSAQTPQRQVSSLQVAIVAAVLLVVGGVLALKTRNATTADTTSPAGMEAGVAPVLPTQDLLPEALFDQLLAEGRPMLAFFHSTTCYQCIRMTEIVEEVYPAFAGSVALVDVDVYDNRNLSLLRRAGIRVIPTLVFIDHAGTGRGFTGIMDSPALREALQTLAEG